MLDKIGHMQSKTGAILKFLPCVLAGFTAASVTFAQQATTISNDGARTHVTSSQTTYRVVNLGQGDYIWPSLINARGRAAFTVSSGIDGPLRSFYFDGKSVHDIGTLGGGFARVTGLNDKGEVTGVSQTTAQTVRSFMWSKRRGMIDIGVLPGAVSAWEPAINNHGHIAGESHGNLLEYPRAFRWSLSSGMEYLGGLASGADSISYGRAINDDGLIAGNSLTAASDYHAFAWTRATGMVDIDTLGNRYSDAIGVDAKGNVGGNFFLENGFTRGFIWTRGGGMRDIGTAGDEGAWIVSMTASGRMSGIVTSSAAYQRAMTWTRDSGVVLLGTFGGVTSNAVGANNKGQVVGSAATADDNWHAFIWTASKGLVDLNTRLRHAPAGLMLYSAQAISDSGSILALSNAGLVLLVPGRDCVCSHTVGPIVAPELVKVGLPFDAAVSFAGEDRAARFNVIWSWGDGSGERAGSTQSRNGSGSATGGHIFSTPGIYTVSARVADLAGKSVAVSRKVFAYDQERVLVAGAGSFVSPHVPNKETRLQAGLASFEFIVPAITSSRDARLHGELQFRVGSLNFRSNQLRATETPGKYVGDGAINGVGNYKFTMLSKASSRKGEEPGTFSLKIWRLDPKTGAELVAYDSQGLGGKTGERRAMIGAIAE